MVDNKGVTRLNCKLTEINICGTKCENLVWFIWSKPNVSVIIFYHKYPHPPCWSAAVGRSHLTQKIFSFFFNSFC